MNSKTILTSLDKTYCFVLDKRYENWLKIQTEFKDRLGLEITPYISGDGGLDVPYNRTNIQERPPAYPLSTTYQTWHSRHNAYNAWISRQNVMKECLDKGYEKVLFLEDDIFIENDFEEILNKIDINFQWDMLYFGTYNYDGSFRKTENEHVIKLNGSGGWHAVILTKNIIKSLLTFPPYGAWDWICGKYLHKFYNCYAITPSIISQTSGHSFIEGHHLTKPER